MADQRRSGPRQAKLWGSFPGLSVSLTANGTFAGPVLDASAPQTVLRMLGEYVIAPDAATVNQDCADVGVGIAVVSTDAATLGATALPDPASEPDYPWLYWATHPFFFNQTGVDPNGAYAQGRFSFDIRSMRKMKARESLVLVVEYVDVAGAPPLQFVSATTRVLLGIH